METQNSINELIYLIAFTKLKGISEIDKKNIFIHLGSAQQVFEYCKSKQELHHIHWPLEIAKREIDFISKHAIQSISILDKDYPEKLIHIDDFDVSANEKVIITTDVYKQYYKEYLKNLFSANDALMILYNDNFRVALATEHIPIAEVAKHITKELINAKLQTLRQSLQKDFGIDKPKIAVLGMNPHAGDNGTIGKEEELILKPTIDTLFQQGHLVFGPYSADAFFARGSYQEFDAVLAMYHDQGLTAFKALSFDEGVNYTSGLPIVRTSPDHGTGYEIAGKNLANPSSFTEALLDDFNWGKGFIKPYKVLASDFLYPNPNNLLIFPDNHDMARFYTQVKNDIDLFKMGIVYYSTMRGIPQFYYGTEILMNSDENPGDHGLIRTDFPGGWIGDKINAFNGDGLSIKQLETQKFFKQILNWRKNNNIIHNGKLIQFAPKDGIYSFFRILENKMVWVIFNRNNSSKTLATSRFDELIENHKSAFDVLNKKKISISEKLIINAKSALILEIE